MATKSYLTALQIEEAKAILKAPSIAPGGDESCPIGDEAHRFSAWLGDRLEERLSAHANWREVEAIRLGSWARGELSAKSDIDLLFIGPEEKVKVLVRDFSAEGIKLRYRVPLDQDDWTKGVEAFDVLAMLSAVATAPDSAERLKKQIAKIDLRKFRSKALKTMSRERKARSLRLDSISNFLEPNLKYGHGGLRDLEQALVVKHRLFAERFDESTHADRVFDYYKNFFLLIRQKLHLCEGASDVLVAPEQKAIADWFGYPEPKNFMREVQKGLARVSFYADWCLEVASASKSRIGAVEAPKLKSSAAFFKALESDPSLLMQNRVRLEVDRVFSAEQDGPQIGRLLSRIINPSRDERAMVAFFRSHLIDHCLPEFRKIIGYVQHDQYHRYTVDAHILQVLRELNRLFKHPKRAGRLAPVVKSLKKRDWEVLALASLYHDLAKGRGGDHSHVGLELARRDLERFKKSDSVISDVCWLVSEHLSLSVAAFRENPRSPRTWRQLQQKGVVGNRISLLAIFTIVDILGTNPEAWTPWKERLLADLVSQLRKPETDQILGFGQALKSRKIRAWEHYSESFDPFLLSSLGGRTIADDLKNLKGRAGSEANVSIRVLRRGSQTWARFHTAVDRPGLFLKYVTCLSASGFAVRHAAIQTDEALGVYDWFEVKTKKSQAQVQKLIEFANRLSPTIDFSVKFDSIELVSEEEAEWVISFRGRDQSGALVEAAQALYEAGCEIKWAKVHTWGRQIDDVFGIKPTKEEAAGLIRKLLSRLS